jgi:hypothetical protein
MNAGIKNEGIRLKTGTVEPKMSSRTGIKFVFGSLTFSAILGLSQGCSFQQDPLATQPEEIRNGVAPETKTEEPPRPDDPSALRIDTNDFYRVREGQLTEIQLSGRVTIGRQTKFTLDVDNLDKFPGAAFDPSTNVFSWTPPTDFVAGDEYTRSLTMDVILTAETNPVRTTKKQVLIFVDRVEANPKIVEVRSDFANQFVREGERAKFFVTVEDPDGVDRDDLRPRLLAVPAKATRDVAAAVVMVPADEAQGGTNPKLDPNNNRRWIYEMMLDLRGREVTVREEEFTFGLIALSRFGRSSSPDTQTLRVRTAVNTPAVSWFDPIRLVIGQENLAQFSVYEPAGQGQVRVEFVRFTHTSPDGATQFGTYDRCDQLPGTASCVCRPQARSGAVFCSIRWKPKADVKPGRLRAEYQVTISSPVPQDSGPGGVRQATLSGDFLLEAAAPASGGVQ